MKQGKVSIALQTNKSAAEYIQLAKLVNQYDFDVVSVYCDLPYQPSFGPLMLMAPHIKKAIIGPAAVSPFRIHPLDIAANTALLSTIATKGVYLGLARGAWLSEHGIEEPISPLAGIREAILIIQKLLTGQNAGLQGNVFKVSDHVSAPYAIPGKKVPILIGTWGKKLATIAGEIADEVKIGGSTNPKMVQHISGYIKKGEQKTGRSMGEVGIVMGAVTVVDEDRIIARKLARMEVAMYLPVVASLDPTVDIEPSLLDRIEKKVRQKDHHGAAELISDDLLKLFAFAGTPADLIHQVSELFEVGATRIEFGTPQGINQSKGIKLLGEKVIPVLFNQ